MRMVLGILLLLSCGCASARYVSKGRNEGEVAMPCNNEANRRKAEELMANHFPEGYEIVMEEETPIGTVTHVQKDVQDEPIALLSFQQQADAENNSGVNLNFPGASRRQTNTTYTTEDKTEWRIRYRRKGPYLPEPAQLPSELLQGQFKELDGSATPSYRNEGGPI